jgi:resolvase-like protein
MDDPPSLRVLGGQADDAVEQLHPEVSEFVRWFTSCGSRAASRSSPTKKLTNGVPPERPLRAVAYVRESTEEQGQGFSLDAQREAIRTFAAENGLALVGEYCDFHSGWKRADGRPEFQRLMSDAAERRFECVLVYHTSRFARNQVEARRYKQMLRERLGIKVLSVTQPMGDDHSDPSAFLVSRSTRCSTSTTRSRCHSGRGPGSARRLGRGTSSVGCRGVTPVSRQRARCARSGYFVEGLGGAQFALPGAVERLRELRPREDEEPEPVVLAAADPAQPYGTALPWPKRADGRAAPRSRCVRRPPRRRARALRRTRRSLPRPAARARRRVAPYLAHRGRRAREARWREAVGGRALRRRARERDGDLPLLLEAGFVAGPRRAVLRA